MTAARRRRATVWENVRPALVLAAFLFCIASQPVCAQIAPLPLGAAPGAAAEGSDENSVDKPGAEKAGNAKAGKAKAGKDKAGKDKAGKATAGKVKAVKSQTKGGNAAESEDEGGMTSKKVRCPPGQTVDKRTKGCI